ncbi:MAG: 4-(cytidine 5'-diphospho)-2-C-methyl-D-erythritol kinase [Eubacterium sp.]
MNEFIIKAPAKVNFSLDVVGKRADGYHEMRMINHAIALSDVLVFKKTDFGIKILCSDPRIPTDKNNLVYKVAEKLQQQYGITQGVCIDIQKNIPSEAGLAGGSSDGAATILGLNIIWHLKLSLNEMIRFGSTIGADIPYCCFKGTALVEGFGEKIKPIKPIRPMNVLVVKPDINIATPWAFGCLDGALEMNHPDIDQIIHCIEIEDYTSLRDLMGNTFEEAVFKEYPLIGKIKKEMFKQGAWSAIMSGSGSTVIGYFETVKDATKAYHHFKKIYKVTFLTETE